MSFFAILFALLIEQARPLSRINPIHAGVRAWAFSVRRNFDAGRQHHGWVAWGLTVVLPALVALGIHWLARQRIKQDPLVMAYLQACRRLAQRGFIRQQDETPQAFVQRLQAANHPAAPIMQQLTGHYLTARYAQADNKLAIRQIKILTRQL